MAPRVSVDTSFLIDLERERIRGGKGGAHEWLDEHDSSELFLSVVALAEFAEGFADPNDPHLAAVRQCHHVLPIDADIALEYARQARRLRRLGRLIGSNDLWIAVTALCHETPIVTANASQFRRVQGLEVLEYRRP
jgi:predicted nucleic acid-binding protein